VLKASAALRTRDCDLEKETEVAMFDISSYSEVIFAWAVQKCSGGALTDVP